MNRDSEILELTPDSLNKYLWEFALATQLQNEKIDLAPAEEEIRGQYARRQGAAMLAQEIIARYGLGPSPDEN